MPNLPSSGPSMNMLDLISLLILCGITQRDAAIVSIRAVPSLSEQLAPSERSIFSIFPTSLKCGQSVSTTGPFAISVAANMGSAAFFAPDTRAVPTILLPPETEMDAICFSFPHKS